MRRTFALVAVALASLAAAAVAALLRPSVQPPPPPQSRHAGALRMTTQLDRRYLPESGASEAYLLVDLAADADPSARRRVPVNAVLILDRSGSMTGSKLDRAREAARALVQALNDADRLAIVEFGSDASVLFSTSPMDAGARVRALRAVDSLQAMGGTNLSAAFDLAGPELMRSRAPGRIDKVFLASDGQANEGISDREGLLALARGDFRGATISTFGMGDDYDEDLMTAFATLSGGRARYISSPQVLVGAVRDELSRAATAVAREVRVHIQGASGASVGGVLGYDSESGWVRLPDFAAGEERRVLVKLHVPPGHGLSDVAQVELKFDDAVSGALVEAASRVQTTFTSDPGLLATAPTAAAVEGARAEMATLAQQAARLQEKGQRAEAQVQVDALRRVAFEAARAAPAQAARMRRAADDWSKDVSAIGVSGDAASKSLKQKTFDEVRAPVAGW